MGRTIGDMFQTTTTSNWSCNAYGWERSSTTSNFLSAFRHIVTRLSAGEAGEFSWAVAGFASIASNMLLRAFIRIMTRLSTLIAREI